MTSELRVDNLKGSTTGGSINVLGEGTSATTNLQQGLCKAWVHVHDNASIDDSFNISSITDNARGDFSFNFATAMANSNYVYLSTSEVGSGNISIAQLVANTLTGRTTAAVRFQYFQIQTLSGGGNTVEPAAAAVAIFGD